jgi:YfiH family protein
MASVLRARRLTEQGFLHGFSTRAGGVSLPPYATLNLGAAVGDDPASVAENQRRFAVEVGYAPERLFVVSQVHGAAVRVVGPHDAPERVRAEAADGLVAGAGACVGVRTADCVPILLADPETRSVAALHAGWKGCVAGVVGSGVQALARHSAAPPARLSAAIFPHIRVCCFEVGADVAEALARAAPGGEVVRRGDALPKDSARGDLRRGGAVRADVGLGAGQALADGGKPRVALVEIVRAQLLAAGLLAAAIDDVPGCTCCEPERFFSYRRDASASGRHLAAIVAG